jgi:type IV pilus assembly protein PilM
MELTLRKRTPGSVGLDVDGSFLAAAMVDGGSIGRVASMDLEPGVAADGEVKDPEALSEAIRELFKRHGLPRTVRLGVANQQIVVRHLDMPLIEDPTEREAAVRFQAAEAIAMPLEEAVLDFQPVGAMEGPGGPRERLLVVAARESMISRLVGAVKSAGLKPESIDLNAFALVRMLSSDPAGLEPGPAEPARVICHLGGIANLAIAVGPLCVFTRPLSTDWSAEGERVAISLAEEIRLSIDFHMAQADARPVNKIVLSGPGASDERFATELGYRAGLEVMVAEPLGTLGTHTVPSHDDPYRYTVAAGLALGATA